ncbi:MAG TPA: SMP-30/gluconolactonase/LRE family protein [Rhizomicrobium sp.]|nr:SMP-30/gluconolactonase/LRE family protein [Rhizomicrobium sp.]
MLESVRRLAPALCLLAPALVPAQAGAQAMMKAQAPGISRLDPALDAVIAPGTKIEKAATGFVFTEGPMWKDGKLWFSDVRGDKVRTLTPDGKVTVILNDSGGIKNAPVTANFGSNAMVTDKDGSILVTRMGIGTIERMDDRGNLKPFLSKYEGKRLNSPNDLVFAKDGALWFTDPSFGLPKMDADPKKELKFNAVFRFAGGKLTPVITDLGQPNGIGFSPDGKTLYISNSMPDMTVWAYDVGPGGKLSGKRKLISYPGSAPDVPDGLKVDSAGNIWTTGPGGVRIITPQGKVLGQIKIPEIVANIAFAEDGRTVYLTGSTSIYRLKAKIPGEIPLYYRK